VTSDHANLRPPKRQKDLPDRARRVEKYPALRGQVPTDRLKRMAV